MSSDFLFESLSNAGIGIVLFAGACSFFKKAHRCFLAHALQKIAEEARPTNWDPVVIYPKPGSSRGRTAEEDCDEESEVGSVEVESKPTDPESTR